MAGLIAPDSLEPDALVPQCLDNLLVSEEVFRDMVSRGVDFQDRHVTAAREHYFQTDFIRCLIYSSQIIVDHTFLTSNYLIYKNYRPAASENLNAFAELMRNQVIVPFLFHETSLTETEEFHMRGKSKAAIRNLLREVGEDVHCVRLAIDQAENDRACAIMASELANELIRLYHLDTLRRKAVSAELFAEPARLSEEGAWLAFEKSLDDLAEYTFRKASELRLENKKLTRQDVYRDWFAEGGSDADIVVGRFRRPGQGDPFLFELKKYVDLAHNVSLPKYLKRSMVTPPGMPSQTALQDFPSQEYSHERISAMLSDAETHEVIRRSFKVASQAATNLPRLGDLTISDVAAIRSLPEWEPFKEEQAHILRDPIRCMANLLAFQQAFSRFQRGLSRWYSRTYQRDHAIDRYYSVVSLMLEVAGYRFITGTRVRGLRLGSASPAAPVLPVGIPKRIKGYSIKLMVGVYDLGRRRLDPERGYTIKLMETDEELARGDIVELVRNLTDAVDAAMHAQGLTADLEIW